MPDPRFFNTHPAISTASALEITGAEFTGSAPNSLLSHVSSIDGANDPGAIIFCDDKKSVEQITTKCFGLCLTNSSLAAEFSDKHSIAIADSPRQAFALLATNLHTSIDHLNSANTTATTGISNTAVIDETATIGTHVKIGAHTYIGPGVVIGAGAKIQANVSITHTVIGENVRILAGAAIGQAGFGFIPTPDGLLRMPQLGRVMIGNNVEIGANSTIDRGALGDTVISDGVKIDNLVQIGHNVRIGRNCVLAAQTGVSGSCTIGDNVFMGGQVGLADHLNIGEGAQLAAGSGLMRDVPSGETWGGRPARLAKDWLREMSALKKLAKKRNG